MRCTGPSEFRSLITVPQKKTAAVRRCGRARRSSRTTVMVLPSRLDASVVVPNLWPKDCGQRGKAVMTDHQQSSAEQFDTWVQIATRYFVFSNAGGAIAVLSFLGTRSGSSRFGCFAIATLTCFVLGLIVTGILIMSRVTAAYRAFLTAHNEDPRAIDKSISSWTTRYYDQQRPARVLNLAFVLFVLGSLIGLAGLGVALLRG